MQIIIDKPLKKIDFAQEWVKFKDDAEFLIAAWDRPAFQRALELSGSNTILEMKGLKTITDESAVESVIEFSRIAGHYLILDFKGLVDQEGKTIEFSQGFAAKLTTESNIAQDLTDFVAREAQRIQSDAQKAREEVVGKSLTSTDMPSSQAQKRQKNTAKNKQQSPKH